MPLLGRAKLVPRAAGPKLEGLVSHRHPKPPSSPKQPVPPKFPHRPPQLVAATRGMVWGGNVNARGAKRHGEKLSQGEGSRGASSRNSLALWEVEGSFPTAEGEPLGIREFGEFPQKPPGEEDYRQAGQIHQFNFSFISMSKKE